MSQEPSLIEARRQPEKRSLRLTWSDGFWAEPTYVYLCGYCPCAGCQGHIGPVVFHPPQGDPEPDRIEPVGNYAIAIGWKNGCQDGIYSFGFLRRICSRGEEAQLAEAAGSEPGPS